MQLHRRRRVGRNNNRIALGEDAFTPASIENTADNESDGTGGNPPMRSMNMNTYASQQGARQAPRLQNTQKPGLGANNAGGWAFGPPSSGGGFGGLGGAPGLGPARPGQLSGFAQVMGGGSGQGPIDMR